MFPDADTVEARAHQPADDPPGHGPDDRLADEVPRRPRPPPFRERPSGGQEDREVDERERECVIEARLRGESKAGLVVLVVDLLALPVPGPLHLHVGGQHRVGGGRVRPREESRPPG